MAWGLHSLDVGIEHVRNAVVVPLLSPARGDVTRFPLVAYSLGFGRAELQLGTTAWQHVSRTGGSSDSEVGDLSVWIKVTGTRQRDRRPAFGVAFGTKLPNASNETGLGTDEPDIFVALLTSHSNEHDEWRANLGMAILGDPLEPAQQEDLLTYGLAGRHGARHALIWEVRGQESHPRPELDGAVARVGYSRRMERWQAEISLTEGIQGGSGGLGATAGIKWLLGSPKAP